MDECNVLRLHRLPINLLFIMYTCDGGQGMRGDILSIHNLAQAGLRGIEGVKEAVLWPRSCCTVVLKVGGKAFIEPQLPPVVTCHQIPKPLHTCSPDVSPGIQRGADTHQQKTCPANSEKFGVEGEGGLGGGMSNNNNSNSSSNSNSNINFDDNSDDDDDNNNNNGSNHDNDNNYYLYS